MADDAPEMVVEVESAAPAAEVAEMAETAPAADAAPEEKSERKRDSDRKRSSSRDRKKSDRDRRRSRSKDRGGDKRRSGGGDRDRRRSRSRDRRDRDRDRDRKRSRSRDRDRNKSSRSSGGGGGGGGGGGDSKDDGRIKIFSSEGLFLGYADEKPKKVSNFDRKPEDLPEEERLKVEASMEKEKAEKEKNRQALQYALNMPIEAKLAPHPTNLGLSLGASLANAAAIKAQLEQQRKARRLHVGKIPVGVDAELLRQFIGTALVSSGLGPEDAIEEVSMNEGGRFAFMAFKSPELASMAMTLDGISLLNSALVIKRPHDYLAAAGLPPAGLPLLFDGMPGGNPLPFPGLENHVLLPMLPAPPLAQVAMGNLMPIETAKKTTLRARRFRIANLPKDPALKAGLPAFLSALLNALKLVSREGDPIVNTEPEEGKDSAVVELRTVLEAKQCKDSVGGLKYGDSLLTAEWLADYMPLSAHEEALLNGTGVVGGKEDIMTVGADVRITVAAKPPGREEATTVLCLSNLLSETELENPEDVAECLEDTTDKCESDVGGVVQGIVVRPGQQGAESEVYVGKMLIMFKDADTAFKGAETLHGLKFDGRPVSASFAPEEIFSRLLIANKAPGLVLD